MSVPDSFAGLPLRADTPPPAPTVDRETWTAPETIEIAPLYTGDHLEGLDALDTLEREELIARRRGFVTIAEPFLTEWILRYSS